jgi:hypothetical protein
MAENNVYKVEFYFDGKEDDADTLRRHLAQSISDDFELCRVYGVTVTLDEDSTGSENG